MLLTDSHFGHHRKKGGVTDDVNGGCIPSVWAIWRVLLLCVLAKWHCLHARSPPLLMLLATPVVFYSGAFKCLLWKRLIVVSLWWWIYIHEQCSSVLLPVRLQWGSVSLFICTFHLLHEVQVLLLFCIKTGLFCVFDVYLETMLVIFVWQPHHFLQRSWVRY